MTPGDLVQGKYTHAGSRPIHIVELVFPDNVVALCGRRLSRNHLRERPWPGREASRCPACHERAGGGG